VRPGRKAVGIATLGLIVYLLIAWYGRISSQRNSAWQRVDLWHEALEGRARGQGLATHAGRGAPHVTFRGKNVEHKTLVRALAIPPGDEARFLVRLGKEPFLSFAPLSANTDPCAAIYRVKVDDEAIFNAQAQHELAAVFGPATVEVELERFAGREIEVVLDHPLRSGCPPVEGIWGSPQIWSRGPTARPRAERPHVLVIGLDTLRADALGFLGRQPSPSPALDRLAGESDVWLEAFATANSTNPSFASIFTGLYAKNHGVYDLGTPLPAASLTLAEILSEAGWRSAGLLSVHHLRHEQSGLGQGFEILQAPDDQLAAEMAVDATMSWLTEHIEVAPDRPFFFWLHLFDPHTPYQPPAPFAVGKSTTQDFGLGRVHDWQVHREEGERAFVDPILGGHKDLYFDEVAYLDRQIGRLLDFLDSRGLLETTIVAVVADHGENLGEQGVFFRHAGLWDATLHVPLLLRAPGPRTQAGRRISGLVQTIDLLPTLLQFLDLPTPAGLDGRSLLDSDRRPLPSRRVIFAEAAEQTGLMARTSSHLLSRVTRKNFLFEEREFFFDLENDPSASRDLGSASGGGPRDELTRFLELFAREPPAAGVNAQPLAAEEVEKLKALGYAG
jgi:arylsulfatase